MATQNCNPGDMGAPAGRIASYIQEVLKLSPAEVNSVVIMFQGANMNTVTPATDIYTVPSDQDLVLFSMQGSLQFAALNSEPTALLSWLNLDPSERALVKSQNCNVKLENLDRKLNVMDARDIPLNSIMPPFGAPLYFPPEVPMLVPHKHRLRATFTLQDNTTAVLGNQTDYNLILVGALIPFRA